MVSRRIVCYGAWCGMLGILAGLLGCSGVEDGPANGSPNAEGAVSNDSAVARLKAAHPGTAVYVQGDRIRRLYGMVATGRTPAASADRFRMNSADALGVRPDELVPARFKNSVGSKDAAAPNESGLGLMPDPATGRFKFRLFNYEQQRDGVPVYGAGLRTLVREGGDNPVVWANTALRPMGSFRAEADAVSFSVDPDKSLAALRDRADLTGRSLPAPTSLGRVSTPIPTIFAGVGAEDEAPRMAMQYTAEDADGLGRWTFVADARTGDILHVESRIHFDIDGTVRAEVTLGKDAMECGPLGVVPLPYAEVTSSAGNAVTDGTGAFTIVETGSGTVTVTSDIKGEFFDVINVAGSNDVMSMDVTPPGPAHFLHEDTASPEELVLAQLNAYKQANEIRDMLLAHVPDYPVIATQTDFPVYVNRTDMDCLRTGGAWYDDESVIRSINFCQKTADYANTAFGSIVHHEYGHHIIEMGGSGQAEYGEGMADTIAMLFAKDPEISVGYYLDNCTEPLRRADRDCRYDEDNCSSCGNGLYDCGSVLSSTVWSIWQALDITAPSSADQIIRSLVLSSIPMHMGTLIGPSIAIDLLTLDDDDELLENGTPHYEEICEGFNLHDMDCPPIVDGLVVKGEDLDAEGPGDGPFEPDSVTYSLHNLGPETTLTYTINTPSDATWLTVDNASGSIPVGTPVTVTVSVDQAQAALLPDGDYTATIEFVNETSGVGTVSREAKLRVGAPVPIYTATFDDDLEGFTLDDEYQNLWHHSTACADALPGHTSPGSLYYGKDDVCEYTTGTPNRHTVTSPVIEIANPRMTELGFSYFLQTENDSNKDDADVLISVDGGPFEVVASNHNGGELLVETSAWESVRVDFSHLMPATGPVSVEVQLAFDAMDIWGNTNTGFAVDDITVYAQLGEVCTSDDDCDDGDDCTEDTCDLLTGTCAFTPIEDVYEAESMIHSTGNAYADGWNIYSNGYIAFSHSFDGGTGEMTVRAAGSFAGGAWPFMRVEVGGASVYTATVNSGSWTDHSFSFPAPVGMREVRIYFTNDYYGGPDNDRNLYVDKAVVPCTAGDPNQPIDLGPVNAQTELPVVGSQDLVIDQLTFSGWNPAKIVVGFGHTDPQPLDGVSVRVEGGGSIPLTGHWQTIEIPFNGQSAIHLTVYSATPRSLRTQWWAM